MEENNEEPKMSLSDMLTKGMLLTDPSQVSGLTTIDKDVLLNPEKYDLTKLSVTDFKAKINGIGKIERYYYKEEDKTSYPKDYFEKWKLISKLVINKELVFLYKKDMPLFILLADENNSEVEKNGVLSFVIAPRLEG